MSEWVLDASAILAYLQDEPGSEMAEEALLDGVVSSVNHNEVVGRLSVSGLADEDVRSVLASLGIRVVDFDEDQAVRAGLMQRKTRSIGLSFGDRACLTLAASLKATALTADSSWLMLDLGVQVRSIRSERS